MISVAKIPVIRTPSLSRMIPPMININANTVSQPYEKRKMAKSVLVQLRSVSSIRLIGESTSWMKYPQNMVNATTARAVQRAFFDSRSEVIIFSVIFILFNLVCQVYYVVSFFCKPISEEDITCYFFILPYK